MTTKTAQAVTDQLRDIKDRIGWHDGPDIRREVMDLIDLIQAVIAKVEGREEK